MHSTKIDLQRIERLKAALETADAVGAAAGRYADFLCRHETGAVLFLELGVGYNTPGIIKYPFWQRTAKNPKAAYACVNLGEALVPPELRTRSICIDGDIGAVLDRL